MPQLDLLVKIFKVPAARCLLVLTVLLIGVPASAHAQVRAEGIMDPLAFSEMQSGLEGLLDKDFFRIEEITPLADYKGVKFVIFTSVVFNVFDLINAFVSSPLIKPPKINYVTAMAAGIEAELEFQFKDQAQDSAVREEGFKALADEISRIEFAPLK